MFERALSTDVLRAILGPRLPRRPYWLAMLRSPPSPTEAMASLKGKRSRNRASTPGNLRYPIGYR